MYAQTVVYGLFIARYNDSTPETFDRYEAIGNLRQESDLLKLFFQHVATANEQHPILDSVIAKLCELYRTADVEALLDQDEDKDTIIHFYEEFLQHYDPALRKELGVFYTPYQVVRWMVRMVDKVLVDELGIEKGLANNETYDLELASTPYHEGKKEKTTITRSVPRVSILDPAVGTGTFHAEIIRYIHDTYFSGSKEAFWKDYILDEHGLMSRLIGFEIMMTSYVVARLKVRRTVSETLGDDVPHARIPASNIFLTNTLTPPQTTLEDADQMRLFAIQDFSGAVTEEARKADTWKSRRPIKVIIGNPPYNTESTNVYDLSAYKTEADGITKLKERNIKPLNDDYVKFIRFSETLLSAESTGILSFIAPHGYFDNSVFRGMRASLLRTFDKIYVLDLHGNSTKQETTPDGKKDENVFNIRQGVGVIVAIKVSDSEEWADVYHADLFGLRTSKLDTLESSIISFSPVVVDKEMAYFVPVASEYKEAYGAGVSLGSLFAMNTVGIITGRTNMAVKNTPQEINSVVSDFRELDAETLRSKYSLGKDARDWQVEWAKRDLTENEGRIIPIGMSPFDSRLTYYTGTTKGFHCYPRYDTMRHFLRYDAPDTQVPIVGMVFAKQTSSQRNWDGVFVADEIIERHFIDYPAKGTGYVAPLYLCPEGMETEWQTNFNEKELERLVGNLSTKPKPLQVFDYIYGLLYDPTYRAKYAEFLKRDYPRVPVVADPEAKGASDAFYVSEERFWQYVDAGSRLRKLHLLQDKHQAELTIGPNNSNDLEIGAIKYTNGTLHINKEKSIHGISEEVWNYYMGGYQVLPKWFKSHKGELLDYDNFTHIEEVVGALAETIKIQQELSNLHNEE